MSKVAALLKANKKDTAVSKGTSKVPSISPDSLHDAVYTAYTTFRDAEAAFRAVEAELLAKVDGIYAENAKHGVFSKSFNLPGFETPGVQVTYQDRFSAIPSENEETLKIMLGDKYNEFFDEKRELSLSDTSDSTVELLMKKLGEDLFLRLFNIRLTISAKKDMDRKQFSLSDDARSFIKQFKASVKLGK